MGGTVDVCPVRDAVFIRSFTHLVPRVIERHHLIAITNVDVRTQLQKHLDTPVVATRRRGHNRRHVPTLRVNVRAVLDQHSHHLAIALRLLYHRQVRLGPSGPSLRGQAPGPP